MSEKKIKYLWPGEKPPLDTTIDVVYLSNTFLVFISMLFISISVLAFLVFATPHS